MAKIIKRERKWIAESEKLNIAGNTLKKGQKRMIIAIGKSYAEVEKKLARAGYETPTERKEFEKIRELRKRTRLQPYYDIP